MRRLGFETQLSHVVDFDAGNIVTVCAFANLRPAVQYSSDTLQNLPMISGAQEKFRIVWACLPFGNLLTAASRAAASTSILESNWRQRRARNSGTVARTTADMHGNCKKHQHGRHCDNAIVAHGNFQCAWQSRTAADLSHKHHMHTL